MSQHSPPDSSASPAINSPSAAEEPTSTSNPSQPSSDGIKSADTQVTAPAVVPTDSGDHPAEPSETVESLPSSQGPDTSLHSHVVDPVASNNVDDSIDPKLPGETDAPAPTETAKTATGDAEDSSRQGQEPAKSDADQIPLIVANESLQKAPTASDLVLIANGATAAPISDTSLRVPNTTTATGQDSVLDADENEGFPPTQTSTQSANSSRQNSISSPVLSAAPPVASDATQITKTPRRLTAYPPISISNSTPDSANADSAETPASAAATIAAKQLATPSTSFALRETSMTRTPIAPKPASTTNSLLIAPKGAKSSSTIQNGVAESATTPVSQPAATATPSMSVTSPSRKRPQSSVSTPSANLASNLAALGPQQRALQSSFLPHHMSTYKKKSTSSPQFGSSEIISTGLYTATYSDIPVFEMMVNGIAVMRRRHDSSLNATQILKVAGVDKSKRTKILEREILTGEHEKVQGGYGKYQGTWIPYDRGVDLCRQYSVYELLQPLLELDPKNPAMDNTPTKEQAMAARRKMAGHMQSAVSANSSFSAVSGPSMSMASPGYAYHDGSIHDHEYNGKAGRMESLPLPQTGMFYHSSNAFGIHPNGPQQQPQLQRIVGSQLAHPSYSMPLHNDPSGAMSQVAWTATTPVRGMPGVLGLDGDEAHSAKRQRLGDYDTSGHGDLVVTTTPSKNIQQQARTPPGSNNTVDQVDDDDDDEDDDNGFIVNEDLIPTANSPLEPLDTNSTPFFESSKEVINHIFLDNVTNLIQLFGSEERLRCFALDIPFDDYGHTALHWASALARISLVKELIRHGAERLRANYAGESALIRAVLVTNNFDNLTFPSLLDLLYPAIPLVDKKGCTVLHHIAMTAGIKGRGEASKYYLSCLMEWIVRKGNRGSPTSRLSLGPFIKTVLNIQDKNGDTALNIAARVGNRNIALQLLKGGADPLIANRAGLRPVDFGFKSIDTLPRPLTDLLADSPSVADVSANIDSELEAIDINNGAPPNSLDALASSTLEYTPNPAHSVAVQDSIRKAKVTQQATANNIRMILGELQTSFEEEIVAKDENIQQLHIKLRESNKQFDATQTRLQQLRYIAQEISNYQRRALNLESAVHEEDERFKAEEVRQGRPILGGIDYEGKFDADQPFRVASVVAVYEKVVKDMEEEAKVKASDDESAVSTSASTAVTNGDATGKSKSTTSDDTLAPSTTELDYNNVLQRAKDELLKKLQEGPTAGTPPVLANGSSTTTPSPPPFSLGQLPPKALLRARIRAYRTNEQHLKDFSQELQSRSIDLEHKFRRVISLCTDVDESRVDSLLEQLVQAVESDPGEVDMSRVAGFLRKVDGSAPPGSAPIPATAPAPAPAPAVSLE